jgi:hypothetical protein
MASLAIGVTSAEANLDTFYSEAGPLRLSVDAIGTNGSSSTIEVEKPAGGTVKKAFLFAASTGGTDFNPPDEEVSINGSPVSWNPDYTVPSDINSVNVAADVTSLVRGTIEAAGPGIVPLEVTEQNTELMDGAILAVIFADPNVRSATVDLLYGAQNPTGDNITIGLPEPLKPSAEATMGLGISY